MVLKVSHKGKIGYRISDVGAGGFEYNVRDYGFSALMKKKKRSKR